MRKVIDAFLYNGETTVLSLRFQELDAAIDEFWIFEADYTFTGLPKDLLFKSHSISHAWPLRKIRYFPILESPETISDDPWDNERFQRNFIANQVHFCNSDDLILLSDVDEIPRPEIVTQIRSNTKHELFGIRMSTHYLKLNFQMIEPSVLAYSVCTVGFHRDHLTTFTADQLRMGIRSGAINAEIVESGGWHFSYLMDLQQIKIKIGAFSHHEFNTEDFLQSIDIHNILKNRNDLYHRPGFVWDFVPIGTLPRTVRENLWKYREHIYIENKIQKMIRRICRSFIGIKENIV
jgi:beta-1,4-mannosyl-glycoprotein beta-1,4-N-acetylglucosaminyltransferase